MRPGWFCILAAVFALCSALAPNPRVRVRRRASIEQPGDSAITQTLELGVTHRLPNIDDGIAKAELQRPQAEMKSRAGCSTNAECLKRGLPLLMPAKLYKANKARAGLSPQPTNTQSPTVTFPADATTPVRSGSSQSYTFTTRGTYYIQAVGGSGAGNTKVSTTGGRRALAEGAYLFEAGTTVTIIVGKQGVLDDGVAGGGGGGGTFVFVGSETNSEPIVVAGGGGGGGGTAGANGVDASLTPDGTTATGEAGTRGLPAGGTGGQGGKANSGDSQNQTGGGGAGYMGAGDPATQVNNNGGQGGRSRGGSFIGGIGAFTNANNHCDGGYGGGGGGGGYSGGGGGGYSGGGGRGYDGVDLSKKYGGGGGGTFVAGSYNGNNVRYRNIDIYTTSVGNGFVQITKLA